MTYQKFDSLGANKSSDTGNNVASESYATESTPMLTMGMNVRYPGIFSKRTLAFVLDIIRWGVFYGNPDLKNQILFLRKLFEMDPITEGATRQIKQIKEDLPYICGSLFARKRSNENFTVAHYIILDFDHVPADEIMTKKKELCQIESVCAAFQSPRDGIKAIVATTPITNQLTFSFVQKHISSEIFAKCGLKSDDAACDCARACFLSYDPLLQINLNPVPLDVEQLKEKFVHFIERKSMGVVDFPAREKKLFTPRDPDTVEDDFDNAMVVVQKLAQITFPYREWIKTGMALKNAFGDRGEEIWQMYGDNPNYKDGTVSLHQKWVSFPYSGSVKLGTLFFIGEKYGIRY